jgi:hypothetical protein
MVHIALGVDELLFFQDFSLATKDVAKSTACGVMAASLEPQTSHLKDPKASGSVNVSPSKYVLISTILCYSDPRFVICMTHDCMVLVQNIHFKISSNLFYLFLLYPIHF